MFHKWAFWKISYYHNVKHRKLQLIKVKESVFIIFFGMYRHKTILRIVTSWKLHMSESSFCIYVITDWWLTQLETCVKH